MIIEEIDRFRQSAIGVDLTPDKQFMAGGNVYAYVSIGKFKRVLAPLFSKAGLDFKFNIVDVIPIADRTRIKVEFILTSVKTAEKDVSVLYSDGAVQVKGGGMESSIKDIGIAMSYAMRDYFSNRFMLVDGIDFDEGAGESLESAMDRVTIPERKKTEEPTENTPRTDDVVEKVSAHVETENKARKDVLSVAERKGSDKAMDVLTAYFTEQKITEEQFDKAKAMYESLTNSTDVYVFMQFKRDIESAFAGQEGM